MLKSKPALLNAFAAAAIDLLQQDGVVTIPGMGQLYKVHAPASVVTDADGTVRLTPPKETVAFEPSSEPSTD